MNDHHSPSAAASAVRAALARARSHAGTAAVAALLVPLGAAEASIVVSTAPVQSSISTTRSTTAGITTYTYRVTNFAVDPSTAIYQFELPEFHAGDFNLASFSHGGWTVDQFLTPQYATTGFKPGSTATPGAYLLFSTTYAGIIEGNYQDFSLTTALSTSTNVNFTTVLGRSDGEGYNYLSNQQIDPLIPGAAATAVPEPASALLMLGGLGAGLGFFRRRKS